jgi:phosphotransferase system enzyme I (PtsI)
MSRTERSAVIQERRLTGIAVSPGVAIGPIFMAAEPVAQLSRASIVATEVAAEQARLEAAIQQSRKQLTKLRARLGGLPEETQAEIAPLLDGYLHMVGPSRLTRGARERIASALVSAETAVADVTEAAALALLGAAAEDDSGTGARHADEVREIGRRLLRNLAQAPFRRLSALPPGVVLVTETLRPADAALLDPARLAGVASEDGSSDGHTAVMLRALGLPAVLGVAGLAAAARPGDVAVVDGSAGVVTLHPGEAALDAAQAAVASYARQRQALGRLRRLPSVTADGEAVELQANLELPAELPLVTQSGAAGIGLLRSEFLFINAEELPDEATQYETYRSIVAAMDPDPVTIRVLDWGGEKESEALASAGLLPAHPEATPALGLRGLRLLLRHPALLEVQLAAILRAAAAGRARVLLPMVSTVAEVRATRAIMQRVGRKLRRRGEKLGEKPPLLGVMIETPAAALSADALALEADFFAIGTNDLTMYALAVDRGGSEVSALYDPLHPGVLRLVRIAIEAALRRHIPVSVCGEVAANPKLAPLLLGMGLRSFSMNASAVPRVKQAIRAARIDDCVRLARRVLEESDPQRIQALILGEPSPSPSGKGPG